jgi:hypothetical protein
LAIGVALLLPAALALADGEGPSRKMTGPEAAGFPLAFKQTEECRDYGTSCISVFLGAFDKEKRVGGYTRYNLRNANLGVTTKPRGLVVVVAGPKEQAQGRRDFLSQVNLAKLKGLLP